MPEILQLAAERRDRAGKGAARAARRAGRVPAVIYGNHEAPLMISVEPKALAREMSRPGFLTRLIDIALDGDAHRVLARDVQLDPVTDRPLHVDFMRVGADSRVYVNVPVQFINQDRCTGIRRGGVLNVVRHEVEMICAATAIPDHLTVDLANHDIGSSIHISMVTIPEGARPAIADRDFTIATIAPPTVEQATTAASETAA